MAIKYNNKYETERRYGIQKSMDKLYDTMYNYGKDTSQTENDTQKKNEPDTTKRFNFASEIDGWAKKNSDAIRFAGDGVINSIKRASKDYLNKYLKDAPEATDKDELLSSIVKWQLARDANDDKRGKVAMNNIIGHMSTENKDHYLKEEIPLSEYVNAKDDFDHKTGKYTTTEYATKEPDENVKKIQQTLNENGAKNKYGDSIEVDGFVGSETLKAVEDLEKDYKDDATIQNLLDMATHEYVWKEKNGALKLYDEKTGHPVSFASADGPVGLQLPEIDDNLYKPGLFQPAYNPDLIYQPKPGNLSPGDEEHSEATKTIIKTLSKNWYRSVGDSEAQGIMHAQAENVRLFDDETFEKAVFLNASDGAWIFGHSGVMLINKDGCSVVFSIFSDEEGSPLDNKAEMRFAVLTAEETNEVLKENGIIENMASSDGQKKKEEYDRFATFEISNENGYKMYEYASSLFSRPGDYKLMSRQCDDIACEILSKGGIYIESKLFPNWTYISIDSADKSKNERK